MSSAVATYQTGAMHRKPLPPGVNSRLQQPLTKIVPDSQFQQQQQQQQQQFYNAQQAQQRQQYNHNRSSTASSTAYSQMASTSQQHPIQNNSVSYQTQMNAFQPTTKRSLSNATASTTSTGGGGGSAVMTRRASASSSTLQRTASSRSGGGQMSYVQLLRKQKATVWSDRTPYEDPNLARQQRAAKMRAAIEVSGASSSSARTSAVGTSSLTGGIRSKVRHHGAPKTTTYAPNTHPAIGVPVRLSANEVELDDDENDDDSTYGYKNFQHHRSGSGRSSNGSGARNSSMFGLHPPQQSSGISRGSTPGSTTAHGNSPNQPSPASSQRRRAESQDFENSDPTPVPESHQHPDYFQKARGLSGDKQASPGNNSGGSNSRENSFGDIGDLPHRQKPIINEQVDLAELRRRGSVDERTMTMSGYSRLFVANPDLE